MGPDSLTLAGQKGEIKAEYLSEKITVSSEKHLSIRETEGTLQEVTERIEQKMVLEALRKSNGNRSQAARILGLTRQGLLNKITRYKIKL